VNKEIAGRDESGKKIITENEKADNVGYKANRTSKAIP